MVLFWILNLCVTYTRGIAQISTFTTNIVAVFFWKFWRVLDIESLIFVKYTPNHSVLKLDNLLTTVVDISKNMLFYGLFWGSCSIILQFPSSMMPSQTGQPNPDFRTWELNYVMARADFLSFFNVFLCARFGSKLYTPAVPKLPREKSVVQFGKAPMFFVNFYKICVLARVFSPSRRYFQKLIWIFKIP